LSRSGGTGTPTAATRASAHVYSPSNEPLAEAGACQMCELCPRRRHCSVLIHIRVGRKGRKRGGGWRGGCGCDIKQDCPEQKDACFMRLRLKITPPVSSSLCACRARDSAYATEVPSELLSAMGRGVATLCRVAYLRILFALSLFGHLPNNERTTTPEDVLEGCATQLLPAAPSQAHVLFG
jgi:hypothetical protein